MRKLTPALSLAVTLLACSFARDGSGQPAASGSAAPASVGPISNPKPTALVQPAESLRIRVTKSSQSIAGLLDPAGPAWTAATSTTLLLSRTPRVYPSEPVAQGNAPRCTVQAIRSGGQLALKLHWDDPTLNAPAAPAAKTGDGGGEPKNLYYRPTSHPSAFADAAAVMIPNRWNGPAFPSLMMGSAKESVTLYHWNATRGGAVLTASGRTTVQPMPGVKLEHRVSHEAGAWTLTLIVPDQPDGYPLSFAIWDGAQGDRDGLKFFTVWYVLESAR